MNDKRDKQRLKQVGAHLREIRESLNLSLADVVRKCEVEKENLSNIENGKKDFTMTTFLELARGLGKHPKKLLDKEFEFLDRWE
jgi:transcriptional regulator with XRE-family HTH domain